MWTHPWLVLRLLGILIWMARVWHPSPPPPRHLCTQSGKHRFWALRVHFILCIACWPLVFMLPETYGPTILERRARALRAKGNIHAFSHEELEHAKLGDVIQKRLFRPVSELVLGATTYGRLTQG